MKGITHVVSMTPLFQPQTHNFNNLTKYGLSPLS